MPTPNLPPRCRHLHSDGRQCGSPALRDKPLCFQHDPLRRPMPVKNLDGRTIPQLPAPDDFLAIQRGIGDVLRLLALSRGLPDELTDRRASALLRGYSIASQNLARQHREERRLLAAENPAQPVIDCVNDPELGTLALADTPISIQQNQDLSPLSEVFETLPADTGHSENGPAPHPQPRFTPLADDTALQDELAIGEMYLRLDESFRDKRRAFIHEKTAELEAEFQSRLETELALRLNEHLEHLKSDRPIPFEASLDRYMTLQTDALLSH